MDDLKSEKEYSSFSLQYFSLDNKWNLWLRCLGFNIQKSLLQF